MEDLLNVKQLAEVIPFPAYTINKMCRMKAIPHYRINSRCFFKLSKIQVWLEKKEEKMVRGK